MGKRRLGVFSKLVGLVLGLAALSLPQAAFGQWQAAVGAQSKDQSRQALAFLPNEIWIHAGDNVQWTFAVNEPHTVTFLKEGQVRPPFSAGCPGVSTNTATFDGSTCITTAPMTKGSTFTVTFPTAGNFKLVCLLHENMTGVVHVLLSGATLPHNQAFYDLQAIEQAADLILDDDVFAAKQGHNHLHLGVSSVTAGTGQVLATGGGSSTASLLRFVNDRAVVHAGETVEWTNTDPVTPHTITFGAPPANPVVPGGSVVTDQDGAVHATITSTADTASSGFIVAAPQERVGLAQSPIGTTRFRVTFLKAGTYSYFCILHGDLGMKGKVVVLP